MARRRNAYFGILVFWIGGTILVLTIALSSRCRRHELEERRDDQVRNMLSEIAENSESTFIVDPDVLPVAGEEDDWSGYEDFSSAETKSASDFSDISGESGSSISEHGSESTTIHESPTDADSSGSEYTLTAYGTISIPSIGCEIPLWDGAGTIELRYGAGRMPLSCEAGKPGNLVILGHRMRRDGSLFNRLGQVVIGDSISILRNGNTFTYQVDEIETIEPSRLSYYMHLEEEGPACRITLITCTPIGVGTHRLLVIGHLVSS
ncbi:MAG: class D sortase [Clostridiales bacterium]|nr:class D sortase [Clostridiales bacterium]